ncbi:olfactory receptor 4K2-like [Paramacrobiotus metropolitanus]|uniref:olfactory receptor 4K2-like n=1 Tax=Paramacrobiotus metropolitanus TaxID=2943436 RepID=UPI00244599D8|nr:olfactory receptor 4K2-like [Paramacrobiotus metropolitanus]
MWTNNSTASLDTAQLTAYLGVSSVACLTTVVLYLLLITMTFRRHRSSSGSHFLLCHQFLAEFLMVSVHWPLLLVQILLAHRRLFASDGFCRHYMFPYMISLTATLWGLFALSFNRFIAIIFPHAYPRFTRQRFLLAQLVACWLLGIFVHLPFYVDTGDNRFVAEPPLGLCNFAHQGEVFVIGSVLRVYLPLALTGVTHIIVLSRVAVTSLHRNGVDATAPAPAKVSVAYRKRVLLTKMLFANWIVHCLCFASVPFFLSVLPGWVFHEMLTLQWLRGVFFLGYLSTPVLFYAMNEELREAAKRLLMRKRPGTAGEKTGASMVHPHSPKEEADTLS